MGLKYPELVLIDVDGTLVDSVPDLTFCVDETMQSLGLPPRGEEAVRQWVGNGVERLVERALVNSVDGRPPQEMLDKVLPVFLELYAHNTSQRSRLYSGVQAGLEFLASEGFRLGSVTNKAECFTIPLLKTLGIFDFFEIVISGDNLPKKKPDPLPLLHAAQRLGVSPRHALMVGDSRSDVKAARAAGFQIVCVSYGYNHGEDIRDYSPDAVIDSMADLSMLLKKAA